ncbi:SPFH domain-containing protein [Massilia aquatica]|uniref:Slipin family protein n=1 Tax=Massilia aquatica TaxID=2609000 RepID=A0ABX0M8H7_9BURK|nr:SPFH domain-containing protein [Massilia aquatica]NHZ42908.1 slipin family protein [Massilia aquatica]
MFQRKLIEERQVGLLSTPKGFDKILGAGSYFLPSSKTVEVLSLSDFPAKVPNLEWLASMHGAALAAHLEIVRTGVDEVALVISGQTQHVVPPNALQAFWKNGLPIEVLRTRAAGDLTVPAAWLARLPIGVSMACIKQVAIPAASFGMLFVDDMFADFLAPGRHAYFDVLPKTRLVTSLQAQVLEAKDVVRSILGSAHAAIGEHLFSVETGGKQLALWWDKNQLVHVSGPARQALASRQLRAELIELDGAPLPVPAHIISAMRGNAAVAALLQPYLTTCEVPSEHVGMFHVDGVFEATLKPGFYAYWHGGKRLAMTAIDTRLIVIEVTGQEMLTQDKVQLRVNVTAGYQITDAQLVTSKLNDYKDFIYKEIQFALRAAIGSRTLDGLLENKNDTDEQILGYMQNKAAVLGIAMISLGIKDLILPGEIKAILGKVVEAEKAAQANVIRRREETAATRSLMNTAKVMEDNPVALRLKELETLEKITEKIEHLNVYGGLEGLLKQLAPLKGPG